MSSDSKLYKVLTANGRSHPYGMIASSEVVRGIPSGCSLVKCTDNLFLADNNGKLFIYDNEKETLKELFSLPNTNEADGFVTEISLSPDVILPVEVLNDSMRIGNDIFKVAVKKAEEKLLVIQFEDGDVILFDTSRFLLYGFINKKFICGYVEV